jgi:hypothetical protein
MAHTTPTGRRTVNDQRAGELVPALEEQPRREAKDLEALVRGERAAALRGGDSAGCRTHLRGGGVVERGDLLLAVLVEYGRPLLALDPATVDEQADIVHAVTLPS